MSASAAAGSPARPLTPLTLAERVAVGEDFFRRCWDVALIGTTLLAAIAVVLALVGRDTAPTGTIVVASLAAAAAAGARRPGGYEWFRRHRYALVLAGPLTAVTSLWPVVDANAVYYLAVAPLALIACVAQHRRERVALITSLAIGTVAAALLDERSPQLRAATNVVPGTLGLVILGVLLSVVVDWCARRILLAPDEHRADREPASDEGPSLAQDAVQRVERERIGAITRATSDQLMRLRPQSLTALTARELQILFLVGESLDRHDIADCLSISPRTVDKHIEHVRAKAGLILTGQPTAWLALQLPRFPSRAPPNRSTAEDAIDAQVRR